MQYTELLLIIVELLNLYLRICWLVDILSGCMYVIFLYLKNKVLHRKLYFPGPMITLSLVNKTTFISNLFTNSTSLQLLSVQRSEDRVQLKVIFMLRGG